jgi:hypothetical protein
MKPERIGTIDKELFFEARFDDDDNYIHDRGKELLYIF